MSIVWSILIGFVAGVVAKLIMPGGNEPKGCLLTTVLGVVGAVLATYLGRYMGWYGPGETAGLLGAIVGAILLLAAWALISGKRRH